MHQREVDAGREGQRVFVDARAADDRDLCAVRGWLRLPDPEGAALAAVERDLGRRRLERRVQRRRHDAARRPEVRAPGDDDVAPAFKDPPDRFVGAPSHDDRLAHRQRTEAGQIGREVPGQATVAADDAVLGHGDDDRDGRTLHRGADRGAWIRPDWPGAANGLPSRPMTRCPAMAVAEGRFTGGGAWRRPRRGR